MTFTEIVQKAIQAKGNSQNATARAMGISHTSVRLWVLGLALPTPEKEAALAALAGVTPEEVEQAVRRAKLEKIARRQAGVAVVAGLLTGLSFPGAAHADRVSPETPNPLSSPSVTRDVLSDVDSRRRAKSAPKTDKLPSAPPPKKKRRDELEPAAA
jgi:DNA-binding transcriptional regulator YdaS (Cro superfamily)